MDNHKKNVAFRHHEWTIHHILPQLSYDGHFLREMPVRRDWKEFYEIVSVRNFLPFFYKLTKLSPSCDFLIDNVACERGSVVKKILTCEMFFRQGVFFFFFFFNSKFNQNTPSPSMTLSAPRMICEISKFSYLKLHFREQSHPLSWTLIFANARACHTHGFSWSCFPGKKYVIR